MDALQLHADRSRPALAHAANLPWLASSQPGVQRKMLERLGGEVAVASSIVRYAPRSRFTQHTHALGEEFLVLSGTFSDEHGHYPTGSYVRNPPGSSHSPFSDEGCVIYVKLRQMALTQSRRVVMTADQMQWATDRCGDGCQQALLYEDALETVSLVQLGAGCTIPARSVTGGEELLVLEGALDMTGTGQALKPWSWLRQPCTALPALYSARGARLWVKRGHLHSQI
ncbi:cupin domain-containing protein [Polaromonas sp.]|uniref:cupin domain-containing protein n=1 Tax=Polaromonas sp. TaxID=1869339 RepID=UPI0032646239